MSEVGKFSERPVDPAIAMEANRQNWDQRASIHAVSEMYDLDGLVADPARITDVVTDDLAILLPYLPGQTMAGLNVVHLQCHIGTDTISLARQGANLTGVDFSAASLDVARSLADRARLSIRYVESEVTRAADVIEDTFDLVYTSIGTITWLPDLKAWANCIARLLKPGGTFFIRDGHPMLYAIDMEPSESLVLFYPYFPNGEALGWDEATTYTDGDHSSITASQTYEWPHPISETITALLEAGLTLVHFAEHQTLPWLALPQMVERDGRFVLPDGLADQVPLSFSIVARKPG